MRFACYLVGVTLRDTARCEDVREQLKVKRFDQDIRECQKKWMQLLGRVDNSGAPIIIMNFKPVGLRDLGRPRSRCKHEF
jgi:hypothetical protein